MRKHKSVRGLLLVAAGTCLQCSSVFAVKPQTFVDELASEEQAIQRACETAGSVEKPTGNRWSDVTSNAITIDQRARLKTLVALFPSSCVEGTSSGKAIAECATQLREALQKPESSPERRAYEALRLTAQQAGACHPSCEAGDLVRFVVNAPLALGAELDMSDAVVAKMMYLTEGASDLVDDLAAQVPYVSGVAAYALRELAADLVARSLEQVLWDLEDRKLVTRAAVSRKACEIYTRPMPFSAVTVAFLKRSILRFAPDNYQHRAVSTCRQLDDANNGCTRMALSLGNKKADAFSPSSLQPELPPQVDVAADQRFDESHRRLLEAAALCAPGECDLRLLGRIASTLEAWPKGEKRSDITMEDLRGQLEAFKPWFGDASETRVAIAALRKSVDDLVNRRNRCEARRSEIAQQRSAFIRELGGASLKLRNNECQYRQRDTETTSQSDSGLSWTYNLSDLCNPWLAPTLQVEESFDKCSWESRADAVATAISRLANDAHAERILVQGWADALGASGRCFQLVRKAAERMDREWLSRNPLCSASNLQACERLKPELPPSHVQWKACAPKPGSACKPEVVNQALSVLRAANLAQLLGASPDAAIALDDPREQTIERVEDDQRGSTPLVIQGVGRGKRRVEITLTGSQVALEKECRYE